MKIDLHVHSKASKRPSQWVLQKLGCPESFTEPKRLYQIAKTRGMDLVTISDHNTISGALEIAHLPDAFISEEITAYFPEDRCKVHVLALNITERQHGDIQHIRENLYDLVQYLHQEAIVHVLAHPLYGINDRYSSDHFERLLLLFQHFELNGARDHLQNVYLKAILTSLQPADIERMSEKYRIRPLFEEPWKKHLTAGSDDHSGLTIAKSYTVIEDADNLETALRMIRMGKIRAVSSPSTPKTMAHNLYGIAWQFYRNKFNLGSHLNNDILMKYLDRVLSPESEEESKGFVAKLIGYWNANRRPKADNGTSKDLKRFILLESHSLIRENPEIMEYSGSPDEKWFGFVKEISARTMASFCNHLMNHLAGADVFDIFHTIGAGGGLYALLSPYFFAYSHFMRSRHFNQKIAQRFDRSGCPEHTVNIAHFTDTLYNVNGVAITLLQQVRTALKNHRKLTMITCAETKHQEDGIRNFNPIGSYDFPEYPELKLCYPPFLEMLDFCFEKRFTHIHSATPGPVGLAALGIARILKLPFSGTYHTQIPQYVGYLTQDSDLESLTWKYIIWYYDQMDTVYVSSQSSADELIGKGISKDKIRLFSRGTDTDLFHPAKRDSYLKRRYGIGNDIVSLLYVGRISKEKNLHLLAEAYRKLCRYTANVHLVVVGDGPYLEEMKASLKETPCTFTGYLSGEELATVYASCSFFVFPSTTDTFGNVILEAQASGIPVIVTDQGGPMENVISGRTGLVVRGNDEGDLLKAMIRLVSSPELVREMGKEARQFMESRSYEQAILKTFDMFLS
uniref:Glycosyltransferase n=1 Tax=Desulfatirhabdium butyrativorans TaxID=340467 RepID=A0A7C4RNH7_9BACT